MLNRKSCFILMFLLFLFCFFPILKTKEASATKFIPQVTIPGSNFKAGATTTIEGGTKPIGEYVISVYNYLLAIVGLVAAIVLMLAGVIWLTAGGSPDKVGQAKNLIKGSLTGLILILVSYTILRVINPALVDFKISGIKQIDPTKKITLCVRFNEGERAGEMKDGQMFITRTQSDLDENEKTIELGGEIKNIAIQCKDEEICTKTKYENKNNIFECIVKENIKCCQYEKVGGVNRACETKINQECEKTINWSGAKLQYIYEGLSCENRDWSEYNDPPCIPVSSGGKF